MYRDLLQAHLRLRATQEERLAAIEGCDGQERRHVEDSGRSLMTVFGEVHVPRLSYGARGASDHHTGDASLNLPNEKASHGLRKPAAEEASKVSFDEVVKAIDAHTGARVAKRQAEELVERAARDLDDYHQSKSGLGAVSTSKKDLLVLTCEAKGIVVLHRDLRDATRKAAESSKHKLDGRRSAGEKRNRKRMATVATIYNVAPFTRTPDDILSDLRPVRDEYLIAGYPIATGVIEGACRHLICDRLDITGARWSVPRAEAVLRLRSLRSSGDFADYWQYHLERELKRNHHSRYAPATFPEPKAA